MITSPTAAARNTITAGTAPAGTANPRVNIEDPASTKAETTPRVANGHSSSANPTYATTSQAASWASKIAAACVASSRSIRLYAASGSIRSKSTIFLITSRYVPTTIRSTHRVSLLLTERDTISVPVTLYAAAITSRPPITAATMRPANGITMAPPSRHRTYSRAAWSA